MSDEVLLEVDDGVAVVSLNRPDKHNAANDAMDAALWGALAEVRDRNDVGAVVLRGNGKSFSSGRDTTELGKRAAGQSDLDFIAAGHAKTRLLYTLDVPILAALKGWVIGGMFERALLCDLRIAATDARMMLPEVRHGVIPDSAGVARLFQMAGHGLATDLALTGRVLDAEEALRHGVVSRIVEPGDLDDTVLAMAREIADRPRLAVRMALSTIRGLATPAIDATLEHEILAQTAVMASDEYKAARDARLGG